MMVHVGVGNYIDSSKVVAVVKADSAPIRRAIHAAENRNMLIDATYGGQTRSVIFMDGGMLVLTRLEPDTFVKRFNDSLKLQTPNIKPDESEKTLPNEKSVPNSVHLLLR